jgi:hypothetical protein
MDMKKSFPAIAIILGLFLVSFASGLSLEVEKIEKVPVIISELKNPAVFDFIINNKGTADTVEIYSLVGVSFEPKGTFSLPSGKTTMEVRAYPGETARAKEGTYSFEYQIKGVGDDLFKDKLAIKIVKLEDVLEMSFDDIKYGDKGAVVTVNNPLNLQLSGVTLSFKSVFFDEDQTISLKPFESKEITLDVKTNDIKDLAAGHYVTSAEVRIEDAEAKIEGSVNYVERGNIESTKSSSGWIVRRTTMTNTNNGNVEAPDKMEVTKNVLTRLFTTTSLEPLSTERKGVLVTYRWEKDLKPAESWTVEVTTNYTLPFILILLIIASAIFVSLYSRTSVVMTKRCTYVRTTGGQFALKVMLHLKAKKSVDSIEVFDRIPGAMKLYEKAGMPHKFDSQAGKLSWKIERLNAGEERIFSYIIHSPIRVVGRLELAPAVVHFSKDGKSQYVSSNRTFFMSEIHPRM